jgi:hypothetical protein
MRRLAAFAALSIAALSALPAEAQTRSLRRSGEDVLILNVRPRSYLDAGNVVQPGSLNRSTSGYGQTVSYLNMPPPAGMREALWHNGILPDRVHGPFVGSRNPFGRVDFSGQGLD